MASSQNEEKSMSLRSFLVLLLIALITLCGIAEATWAETGGRTWPDQEQLKRQLQHCHLSKAPEGIPANEARAATLDYENQCYGQLTEIEHEKLDALQQAIARNRAHKMADQTLLKREPLPKCQLSKPPEAVPENEARLAKLDYENQCYRQLAEMEFRKLDALQETADRMAQSPKLVQRIHHRRTAARQPFMIQFQATR